MAEPNWKPWVHSVHPREVYFPCTVKTGVPFAGSHCFSRLRIFPAERSKSRTIFGRSLCAVRRWSGFRAILACVVNGRRVKQAGRGSQEKKFHKQNSRALPSRYNLLK